MKKTIFILALILIIVFGVFTALDYRGEYAAERDLWKINDKFAHAAIDPGSVPDSTFESIAARYSAFVKKFPDSKLVPAAHILVGRVYLTKGDYSKARQKYEEIVNIYNDKPNIAVEALADIGRTYALEDDSEGVIQNYKRVMNEYPLTPIGMQAPLILAKFHAERGDTAIAEKAFAEASAHFSKIIKENAGTTVEFNALRSLGATYMASRKYEEAVDTFGKILIGFPQRKYLNTQRVQNIVKTINTVSVVELKDYEKPISIYTEFVTKHPNHPFTATFEEMINSLTLLRNKKVEFSLQKDQ